jgi:hypothetical protein
MAAANSGIPGCTVADYCAAACSCPFALHRIVQDGGTLLFRSQRLCLTYSARISCWHRRCRRPASRRLVPIRPRGGQPPVTLMWSASAGAQWQRSHHRAAPAAVQHYRPDRGTYKVSRAGQPHTIAALTNAAAFMRTQCRRTHGCVNPAPTRHQLKRLLGKKLTIRSTHRGARAACNLRHNRSCEKPGGEINIKSA